MSSAADLSKIHVTNTTGLSLNDRFTAIASTAAAPVAAQVRVGRSRSRSRSRARSLQREFPPVDPATSMANARLLKNLARKHSMQAALKLKRRSMRNARTASILRGSTLRRNGVPPNVGTMRSDLIAARRAGRPLRPLRRSNSMAGLNGAMRQIPGGAAERVARRQLERLRAQQLALANERRVRRSRSRSRVRAPTLMPIPRVGRSRSRGRMPVANAQLAANSMRRARSSSRNRAAMFNARKGAARVSIKDRLGVRPGAAANINNRNRRGNSLSRRGIAKGRVEKRSNVANGMGGTGKRLARERASSAVRNAGQRSRSRTRRGQLGNGQAQQQRQQQQQQQRQKSGNRNTNGMASVRGRSRSRQRKNNNNNNNKANNINAQRNAQRNGRQNGRNASRGRPAKQQQQAQQQRGRSRSRNARAAGGAKQGKNNARTQVSKDALDKELDQYMATTKTESNMDYILNH